MFLINSPLKDLGDKACQVFHGAPHPLHVALNAGVGIITINNNNDNNNDAGGGIITINNNNNNNDASVGVITCNA